MNMFSCPQCGSENTTRCSLGLFDGLGVGHYIWWGVALLLIIIGGGILLIPFVIIELIFLFFRSQKRKGDAKGKIVMKCRRCKHEFMIDNPDAIDSFKAMSFNDKVEAVAAANADIKDDEEIVAEFGAAFAKMSDATLCYNLTITGQALVLSSAENCIRVEKSDIIDLKFTARLGIPGITIKTNEKTWRFMAVGLATSKGKETRQQYLEILPQWLASK